MTQIEWLASKSSQPMLGFLRSKLGYQDGFFKSLGAGVPTEGPPVRCSRRKIALFVLAVCERLGHLWLNKHTKKGLQELDRFAFGTITLDELIKRLETVREEYDVSGQYFPFYETKVDEPYCAFWIVRRSAIVQAWHSSREAIQREDPDAYEFHGDNWKGTGLELPEWQAAYAQEEVSQAHLLRDIVGNPFRPVAVDPSWLSSTAVAIAQGIYEEKAFDRLPILADALQDAGCENADILDHLRSDGPHVKGCWALDLVLGKS